MKAFKIAGILACIILLGLAILFAVAPSSNHEESTIIINAPASAIYREANSFKNFNTWSPWSKIDPQAVYTYEGPDAGMGSKMSWDGPEMGKGSQEIIESVENEVVKNRIVFENLSGSFISKIHLEPVVGGTKVTWTYDSNYTQSAGMTGSFGKVIDMIFLKGMIREQYKHGLEELKRIVESHPQD